MKISPAVRQWMYAICFMVLASPGWAAAPLPDDWDTATAERYRPSPVATLSLSPAWTSNRGNNQTIVIQPDLEKTYVPTNSTRTFFEGELFLGGQLALTHYLAAQLGIVGAATNSFGISGIIWDDADPRFDNYVYSYHVSHTHLALKAKFLGTAIYDLHPYLSGSIGLGLNQARRFQSTPLIEEAVPTPNFGNQTHTAAVYAVGLGLQKPIGEHWHMGLGYEFESWGRTELANGPDQLFGRAAFVPNLYVNEVMWSLTYVWN